MPDSPNFLIIMSDQHAPDTIGGLGHPAVQTPALDSLMARGVTFTSAYCAYPMCTPARASFMTGMLTPQHGVWELGTPLRSDLPTWAHVLRTAGYRTTICGRMHFVGPDLMHGFEHRIYPQKSGTAPVPPYAYADWDHPQEDDHVMIRAIREAGPTDKPTDAEQYDTGVCEAALQEIKQRAASGDDQPWALMVGLFQPHFPFRISQPYYDRYDGIEIPMPRIPPDDASYASLIPPQLADSRKFLGLTTDGASDEEARTARRCYYAMITQIDEMVGRLVDRLQALGLGDNTWVVYLSDHGDNMGEHGLWSKLNFYEDSVRTPLIIAPPRYSQGGARCAANVSHVDWFPTVLDMVGDGGWIEELPGRSLVPLLENPDDMWIDRAVFSDYACVGTRVPMRMVRRGRWKACFAGGFPPNLFDLDRDPCEWRDMGQSMDRADIIQEMALLARTGGWEPERLREEIGVHQRRLHYIAGVERQS